MVGTIEIENTAIGTDGAPAGLSAFQRRVLASDAVLSGSPHNSMILLVEFPDGVDQARLARAVADVIAAHGVFGLRVQADGTPEIGRPDRQRDALVRVAMPLSERHQWLRARNAAALDMSRAAHEFALLDHGADGAALYIKLHHSITDGHSVMVMMRELARAYGGAAPVGSAFVPRPDACETTGWPAPPEPVGAVFHPDNPGGNQASRNPFMLEPGTHERLTALLSGAFRVLSDDLSQMVFHAACLAVWIGRTSGREAVRIGVPLHHRNAANAGLIGPQIELYPLDLELRGKADFTTLHAHVAERTMDLLRRAAPGNSPAVPYEFVLNYVPGTGAAFDFAGQSARLHYLFPGALDPQQIARYQIHRFGLGPDAVADPSGGAGLHHELNLRRTAGGAGAEKAGAAHLARIIATVCRDPSVALRDIVLVGDSERDRLSVWQSGAAVAPAGTDIAPLLVAALQGRGDAAVDTLTGQDVLDRAQGFAVHLQENGWGAGTRIGLALPPGPDFVVAVYGALLAGVSFVPLDLSLPASRRQALAGAAGLATTFGAGGRAVEAAWQAGAARGTAPARGGWPSIAPGAEAYLLFTSGTTGQPKGVPIPREGLRQYLEFAKDAYFADDPRPVAPLFGNLGFDLTLTSLFAPILAGGRLICVPGQGAEPLARIAQETAITWIKATPSHLEILARLLPADHRIATMVIGGEALGRGLIERLEKAGRPIAVFNEYGPTETVVGCMIHDARAADPAGEANVPIGLPAPGVALRIVDASGRDQPPGIAGELWVSRPGMTPGYETGAGQPDADAFVSDTSGRRYYRTGDLAYLGADGAAVYLGRIDSQLKVGGVRLEPEEIERALEQHPAVQSAVVRYWSPRPRPARHRCPGCGLPDNVPGVRFDETGQCSSCRDFERVAEETRNWFRTPQALREEIRAPSPSSGGQAVTHDCMFLLSGGKDSTYALYGLVDLGLKPYVLTLDNGYLSPDAKRNIDAVVTHLGVPHEYVETSAMKDIFRDSLRSYSNVCQGCFKTIYTLALRRANALGLRWVVTGLSRGQLFETRLIPQQFQKHRFDAEAIDAAVLAARRQYHLANDLIREKLDDGFIGDGAILDRIGFVDFYRYVDVSLTEVMRYLREETPWVRPRDTGRSSNCLINVAGIHTHLTEQGYHNYAVPYAWDVRLGHKTRAEAIEELEDGITADEVDPLLRALDYRPEPRRILTAWWTPSQSSGAGSGGDLASALRRHLQELLPEHAIPQAYVAMDELPLTASGKLDSDRLAAPERRVRSNVEIPLRSVTETEREIITVWENVLKLAPIGPADRFSALGGDSLMAVRMILELSRRLNLRIPERLGFRPGTLAELAQEIEGLRDQGAGGTAGKPNGPLPRVDGTAAPALSMHEKTLFFEHRSRPESPRYNVCSLSFVEKAPDEVRLAQAIRSVAAVHEPLSWSYGGRRTRLPVGQAVDIRPAIHVADVEAARAAAHEMHVQPFDLGQGPLLRCQMMTVGTGGAAIALVAHHISCDQASFEQLWEQIDQAYETGRIAAPAIGYGEVAAWQEAASEAESAAFWLDKGRMPLPDGFYFGPPHAPAGGSGQVPPDGLIRLAGRITRDRFDREFATTPVALSLAAMMKALRPYARGPRLSVGLISTSRTHQAAEHLVGYFLNPIPVCVDYPEGLEFDQLLARVEQELADVLPHRAYPFARIHADRLEAGLAPPSADVLLAVKRNEKQRFQGAEMTSEVLFSGHAVSTLTIFNEMYVHDPRYLLEHAGSTLSSATAETILQRFREALELYARTNS